jgi:hypothetical protein
MRGVLTALLPTAFAAAAAGCLPLMPVSSHIEPGIDLTRYETYAWGPADALPLSDPRLRENAVFVHDVHGAIDRGLQRRGLRPADSDPADVLVHYHAAVERRLEVPARHEPFSDCVGDECSRNVVGYDAGTLIIDLVDPRTQRTVWRGWAEHRLEDMLDDPRAVRRRIDDAVRRILDTLPPTPIARSRVWTEAER